MLLTFHEEDSTADRHQAIRSSSVTKRNPRPQLRRASIHQGLQPSTPVQSRRKASRRPTLKQFLTAEEDARWGSGVNANNTGVFSKQCSTHESFESIPWPEAPLTPPKRTSRSLASPTTRKCHGQYDSSNVSAPVPLPFLEQESVKQNKLASHGTLPKQGCTSEMVDSNPIEFSLEYKWEPAMPNSSSGSISGDTLALQNAVEAVQQQALTLLGSSHALNLSFRRLELKRRQHVQI